MSRRTSSRTAILTTNTSGLPIAAVGASCPSRLRRRWFGTHFFNPPALHAAGRRSSRTPEADPDAVEAIAHFADQRLGKEVVFARDTPNFIANRIGVFIMLEAIRLMQSEDLTIEEVDALTGPAIGWPRTGTFRLADLVGLDVMAHVANNFARLRSAAEAEMSTPPFIQTMLERRWLGDKTGQGFYKKETRCRGQRGPPGARLEDPGIPPRRQTQAAFARNGEERRAAPRPPAATAFRRHQEG